MPCHAMLAFVLACHTCPNEEQERQITSLVVVAGCIIRATCGVCGSGRRGRERRLRRDTWTVEQAHTQQQAAPFVA